MHFVDDPDVTVVAAVVEQLKNPRKLCARARRATRRTKVAGVLPRRHGRRRDRS